MSSNPLLAFSSKLLPYISHVAPHSGLPVTIMRWFIGYTVGN